MWCSVGVDRALSGVPGVLEMQIDFDAGDLRIDYDASRVSPAQLEEQLEQAGYQLGPRF